MCRKGLPLLFLLVIPLALQAQEHDAGTYPEALRGEVWIELEPIFGGRIDVDYPLTPETADKRAREQAAMLYSAMIYGWNFQYEVGEKSRRIAEKFEFFPIASISIDDPALVSTHTEINETDMRFYLWTDYLLNDSQQRRLLSWRKNTIRNAQGIGYSPLGGPSETANWLDIRTAALEDAARAAVRGALQGSERNRPKEVTGFISLASFPRYFMQSGQWAVSARFRVDIEEIIPFAVY